MSAFMTDQFFNLDPNIILTDAERQGYISTGEIHQLNSYENRVFDIKLDQDQAHQSIIAKYFRPKRWSKDTILDEHEFCFDLDEEGLSVGKPLRRKTDNETVFDSSGILYCYYEKVRGRMMQEILLPQFSKLGHCVATLHNVGERKIAHNRESLGPQLGNKWQILDQLYDHVAPEVRNDYFDIAEDVFQKLDDQLKPENYIRIHGDLHRGNLLDAGNNEITLVDFDDFVNGPPIQDFWMIFPDENFSNTKEYEEFMKGYELLRYFDEADLALVPLLRCYRVINYAGWILNRWADPSFPKIFPEFGTYSYWAEETDSLRKIASQY